MFGLWLLLTWSLEAGNVIAGLIVAAGSAVLFGRYFPHPVRNVVNPGQIFWAAVYLPYFIAYCVKANLDVTYRVLHRDLPIRPGIVKVKTTLQSDMAKAFLANSITLTPGTLTVDIVGDEMYIHWINVQGEGVEEHTRAIVQDFEKFVKRIFEP
jgi:multicomponent Na+:H+ antiporter subunit E